jgi:transposase
VLRVREMTAEEAAEVKRLANSRTEAARAVERAQIIRLASEGKRVPQIAEELGITEGTVRLWIKRFNECGLRGLEDLPRSGKPPTYTPEQVGEVIATSLTDPRTLKLPFASWTLDRLEAYLSEEKGIAIKRSRISEILIAEGLRWRAQETWFGEQVDPEFAQKRGSSRSYTPSRLRVVS